MSDLRVHYEVRFAGRKLSPAPFSVSFERAVSHNTVATVRALYPEALPMRYRPQLPAAGTPVEVQWGIAPAQLRTWWGYVHHSRPDHDHPEGPGMEAVSYVLAGTGHAMETQRTKDWRKITDSGIALKIAEDYGLSAVVHKTTRIHPYLLQPGVSDLDWLRLRAREVGRRVHVENGVLYFVDPASLAMARTSRALPVKMDKGRDGEAVVNVEPLYGTLVPRAGKQARRDLTGFDLDTNRLINAKQTPGKPSPDFVARDTAITSPTDLYTNAQALSVEHEEWLHATMQIKHLSDVEHLPGQLVNLTGKAVSPQMHGTWLITEAAHHLESRLVSKLGTRRFDSSLTLSRNTDQGFQMRDRRAPRVDDGCMLSGGRWRARNRQVVIL